MFSLQNRRKVPPSSRVHCSARLGIIVAIYYREEKSAGCCLQNDNGNHKHAGAAAAQRDLPGLCGHWGIGKGAYGEEVPPSPMGTASHGTNRHLLWSRDGHAPGRGRQGPSSPGHSCCFSAISGSSGNISSARAELPARTGHRPQDRGYQSRALHAHQDQPCPQVEAITDH